MWTTGPQVTIVEGLRLLERSEVPKVDLPGESYSASQPLLEFNPTGKPVCLLGGGLTTNRPSCLSPIGFHLPEGRLLQASRPVSQPRRAPPLPSRGLKREFPWPRLRHPTCCRPGQAERSRRHAQSTRSRSSSPTPPFMTVTPGRRLLQPLLQALLPYPPAARVPLAPSALKPARAPCPLPAAR
ncbi:hypothetical protein LEMLEM_LOCUS4180 [Lemmus lemmus]